MPENIINRAGILIRQNRFNEADQLLKGLLTENPNNVHVLAMLSEVKLHQNKNDDAESLINSAIGLSPDSDYLYYIKSRIDIQKDRYDDAETDIQQAIQLNPEDADYYALWASIKLTRKQYETALELADQSLGLQPDNLLGLNIRSTSLIKLGRKEDAFATIEGALVHDPNNAYTHSNYGWGLLEKGNHKKALEHFKEALKLNPNMANAQAGMAEALKARYFSYRLFLQYSFWMNNLTSKYQWGVIIGFYVLSRVLNAIAESNEILQPYIIPLLVILAIVAFSTWIFTPISNLFLRLNPFGKYLLDKEEKMNSNLVGLCAIICITGLLLYFILGILTCLSIAIFGFAMMIPFGSLFSREKQKKTMIIYAIAMSSIGILGIVQSLFTGNLYNFFSVIFLLGFIVFQWMTNYFNIKRSNY